MAHLQHIYSLADPLSIETVRYVGRSNDLDQRLRMHLAEAEYGFTIKDVWLMYLRYGGREPAMTVVEQSEFGDKASGERWAKDREKFWIKELATADAPLLNGPKWSGHRDRKSIPKGVKTAWCEAHVLFWAVDRSWRDESQLLRYLNERYGSIIRETPQPNGSTLCESMAEFSLAQSQYEGRRFRAYSVLRALLEAHPLLSVGDLKTLLDFEVCET